ncbi:MAG TPA: FHA domain-containing protein [Gemmatimonadales bacterium]|nr:FHA domain-containing protein [Gemmatimonadales bacterium]
MSACNFCGRQNETGAQFCTDCGKPLTKAAAIGLVDPPRFSPVTPGTRFCGTCGAPLHDPGDGAAGGGSRLTPDTQIDYTHTLVLVNDTGNEVQRFERRQPATTIGRQEGDIRFPEDAFLSPLHAKVSWEEDRLEVRDLGSRNGTWVFLEAPYRLVDGDLVLIGSQVIRFRRLGYPGPHAPDADATRRVGSLVPSADIASLTQLRTDGSSRDTIQLSPGRDVHIGRERGDWIFPYDPSMSAQHATVRSEDADFVLLDDHSRNGIAIAARGAMTLRDGSRIMVGDKLLRVELPS